jgi:N-acetylneuraminate synthase
MNVMSQVIQPLFVFELANNHMGDVEHGHALIRAFGDVIRDYPEFAFAFKFQYRDLDTFVHASARGRTDIAYVKRFEETRLDDAAFGALIATVRAAGFAAMCTPFDEVSVGKVVDHGFDYLKIASCSFGDWPLMERIAAAGLPTVASTAGASVETLDRVVGFFDHRSPLFALMHCVAEYPAPDAGLQIGQVGFLKSRYRHLRIGYSTHELPSNAQAVLVAVAQGATVFEKHVALPSEVYGGNAYSATPDQVRVWLDGARHAFAMLGPTGSNTRYAPTVKERDSLQSLRRGVFATRAIAVGERLDATNIEFAFPPTSGQVVANDWSKYVESTAKTPIPSGAAVMRTMITSTDHRARIRGIAVRAKALLKDSKVVVPTTGDLEISHHYGLERFDETGMTMFTVVNRGYCKKILVLFEGQRHPEQFHRRKEETFVVLHGTVELRLDGIDSVAEVGDVIHVAAGVRHALRARSGAVIEEISSTHLSDDSFYTDPAIAANRDRKTFLRYWIDA